MKTQFNSLITESGRKRFELSYPGPKADIVTLKRQPVSKAWPEKKVIAHLDGTLSENHFCRKGYLILGRYAGETTHKIRGECKETASPEDHKKFPNTINRW